MALTKTVNYIQTVPQSLGFATELSGKTGTVTATFTFNNKMGSLSTSYSAVSSLLHGCGTQEERANVWEISGTEAEVNAALDGLTWTPRVYADAAIQQDTASEHRTVTAHEGEALFQVEDRFGLFSFSVGDVFGVQTNTTLVEYTCTAVETTLSGKRIYGTPNVDLGGKCEGGATPNWADPIPYTSELVILPNTVVDNIVDYAIVNPHGNSTIDIQITDDGGVTNDVLTLNGSFFVPEPYFTTYPANTILDVAGEDCSAPTVMGEIAQANNELVTVQLLFKRHQNDPAFDGDVALNKPSYITNNDYGQVNQAKVDNRVSQSYDTGIVRWEFYGTPDQCTKALSKIRIVDNPCSSPKDFYIETRIVNGRARIYSERGYN